MEKQIRPHLRMSNGSWRVNETYVKVKGGQVRNISGCDINAQAAFIAKLVEFIA